MNNNRSTSIYDFNNRESRRKKGFSHGFKIKATLPKKAK